MNSRNRKKYFQLIVQRDGGAYCFIGGEPLTYETAVIDHWDNDNSNNDLENLHLMCKSANAVKNPRGRDSRHKVLSPVCGNVYVQIFENEHLRVNSLELLKNMQAEPDFKHWLFRKVVREGSVLFEDSLDEGAAVARCSQETIRRYLKKEVSKVRLYRVVLDAITKKKMVELKPEWRTFLKKAEEKKELDRIVKNWKELLKDDPRSLGQTEAKKGVERRGCEKHE
jgi:hypothetical protein